MGDELYAKPANFSGPSYFDNRVKNRVEAFYTKLIVFIYLALNNIDN